MIDIAITKLSSKGQIVIPVEMRGNFSEGEKLLIIKNGEQLILKKVSDSGKISKRILLLPKEQKKVSTSNLRVTGTILNRKATLQVEW